jgi:hypothetical protein
VKKVMSTEKMSEVQLKQRIIHLQSELNSYRRRVDHYQKDPLNQELDYLREQHSFLTGQNKVLREEIDVLKQKAEAEEVRGRELLQKLEAVRESVKELTQAESSAKEESVKLRRDYEVQMQEYEKLKKALEKEETEKKMQKQRFEKAEEEWERDRADLQLAGAAAGELEKEIELLRAELRTYRPMAQYQMSPYIANTDKGDRDRRKPFPFPAPAKADTADPRSFRVSDFETSEPVEEGWVKGRNRVKVTDSKSRAGHTPHGSRSRAEPEKTKLDPEEVLIQKENERAAEEEGQNEIVKGKNSTCSAAENHSGDPDHEEKK